MSEPGKPSRRRGRGIDAIFDSTDLDLGPARRDPRPPVEGDSTERPGEEERTEEAAARRSGGMRREPPGGPGGAPESDEARFGTTRDRYVDRRFGDAGETGKGEEVGLRSGAGATAPGGTPWESAQQTAGMAAKEATGLGAHRRSPGRPPSDRPPGRELVQRGFYLEVEQDRTLDETKAALKSRGFTPDRSAIVRAALEHFARLARLDQEELVRRQK